MLVPRTATQLAVGEACLRSSSASSSRRTWVSAPYTPPSWRSGHTFALRRRRRARGSFTSAHTLLPSHSSLGRRFLYFAEGLKRGSGPQFSADYRALWDGCSGQLRHADDTGVLAGFGLAVVLLAPSIFGNSAFLPADISMRAFPGACEPPPGIARFHSNPYSTDETLLYAPQPGVPITKSVLCTAWPSAPRAKRRWESDPVAQNAQD